MFMRRLLPVGLLVLSLGAVLARAEMIDNPAYASWASHKAGTKVTMQSQTSAMGMNMTQDMTQTLQEITPEKVIIETAVTMDMGGTKHEMKQKQDVPAKIEQGHENMPSDMKGSIKEVGKETVQISDKSYECRVMEYTGENSQGKATGKIWTCGDIPGNVAKTETKMQAPQEATVSLKVTAIELK